MSSNVQLCNKALRRLGEDPIIALDNNTIWGRRCSSALPEVTRTVLTMDAWRSVTKRVELAAESETPLGYQSAYLLPADCLRLGALKLGQYTDWAIEGNKILTKQPKDSSLQILYVYEEFDTNKYTAPLFDAIAYGLAHELSGYSTATNVSKDEIYQFYAQAVATAQNINAKETPVTFLSSTSWVDVRLGNQDRSVYSEIY
jgi:hypothetical protein